MEDRFAQHIIYNSLLIMIFYLTSTVVDVSNNKCLVLNWGVVLLVTNYNRKINQFGLHNFKSEISIYAIQTLNIMKNKYILGIANVLVLLVGVIHLITHFFSGFAGTNESQQQALEMTKSVPFEMPGGQLRTLDEISSGYGLVWAVLLITISLIGFMSVGSKRLYYLLGLGCLEVSLIMFFYLITPPALMLALAGVLFFIRAYGHVDHTPA